MYVYIPVCRISVQASIEPNVSKRNILQHQLLEILLEFFLEQLDSNVQFFNNSSTAIIKSLSLSSDRAWLLVMPCFVCNKGAVVTPKAGKETSCT